VTAASVSAVVPLADSVSADAVFQPLAGTAPLLRVVRDALDATPSVVVAATERLVADVRAALADAGLRAVAVAPVDGSAGRAQCLAAGLKALVGSPDSSRHVLVYDIRQPLTSADVRGRVIARLADGEPVVLPVLAVTDSVKAVDGHGVVEATLDRSTLQTVQYPRGFAVHHLVRLLDTAPDEFDEVAAAVDAGTVVSTVDGDAEAVVVDLPRDAHFVEAVIASRAR
jgi:2-C-methyl-D-erythritol 4-phosphate cytidylyltransferase